MKAIFINNDGTKEEFENFVLLGFDENGCRTVLNVGLQSLCYAKDKLVFSVAQRFNEEAKGVEV